MATRVPTAADTVAYDQGKEGGKEFSSDVNSATSPERVPQASWATRAGLTAESFKRREVQDEHNNLAQTLKSRHLNMIAIGGSIGAGLFVGSGSALYRGGPASLLICFVIIGVMIFNVVYALGELAIMYPISGGFYTYSVRFIDPSWGFAMGWNYVLQWIIILPLELVVAGLTIDYWQLDISNAVWITVFWVICMFINVFGVIGYAEEEFWVSGLKLGTIIVFLFMGLIFVLGGGPSDGMYGEYWGARTWYDPGAFSNETDYGVAYGFFRSFVTAAFSFAGTELVGLAAAESATPQKSLPSAIKQVFWRITLFYVLSLLFVGLLVPHDTDRLLGSGFIDVTASPFVIVAENAGIPGFGHFMNVVIMISVFSIGLSGVYGGSRTLTALAEQGYAPKIFAFVDKAGRPSVSVAFCIAFGPIAYISLASGGAVVFDWLLALSGLAALFTWGSICLAHIRFRSAWSYHGHSLDEIPFKAAFGTAGSWIGLIIIVVVLILQLYVAIQPLDVIAFFQTYLAFFVVIIFYIGGYLWKRKTWLKLSEINVDAGRREVDWSHFEKQRQREATWPAWRRQMHKFI